MVLKKMSKVISVVPAIKVGAYSAGNILGTLMELTNAVNDSSGVAELVSVCVCDKAKQDQIMNLWFFKSRPAGTFTDATSFDPTQADLNLLHAMVSVPVSAYVDTANNGVASVGNIRKKIQAAVSTDATLAANKSKSLWLIVTTGGTPTYGAVDALKISIGFEQDS